MKLFSLCFVFYAFLFCDLWAQEPGAPPNIILIMCDDLGYGDVGFNGSDTALTPHLDRLAGQGVRLARFYSAGAVCSPTRASCLTGRNPYRMGIYTANAGHLKTEEITLPELLAGQGYATGHFGKWHLGTLTTMIKDANRGMPRNYEHYALPTSHGYEEYFCTESKVPTWDPLFKPTVFDEERGESLRYGWSAVEDATDPRTLTSYGTYYWKGRETPELDNLEGDNSRIIMDRVLPFVEKASRAKRPFFATVWFHTPHLPVVTGQRHRGRFAGLSHREQLYYGAIAAMDDQVGRLWEYLAGMGLSENTMIWFCSDNGPERQTPGSAGPYRGRKRSLYEGGLRVPAFVLWPGGIAGGGILSDPMVTSDYLPTILDLLNLDFPDADRPLDGVSLLPVLTRRQTASRQPIGFRNRTRISWVTEQFKLISNDEGQTFELYDLLADPGESNDLIQKMPDTAAQMKKALFAWIDSCRKSDEGRDY